MGQHLIAARPNLSGRKTRSRKKKTGLKPVFFAYTKQLGSLALFQFDKVPGNTAGV